VTMSHNGQCTLQGLHLNGHNRATLDRAMGGRLNLGGEGRECSIPLVDFVHRHGGGLIVDLQNLRGVDSRGLGALVRATTVLGDRLRFIHLSNRLTP